MVQITKKAKVIAFAGLDGAGKSTQCELLAQHLRSNGHRTVVFRNESLQPVKGALDDVARRRGFDDHIEMLSPSRAYLLTALFKWNGMLHAVEHIETPEQFVIMDRYASCYVAAGHGSLPEHVSLVRALFAAFPPPDLTIYLDISSADASRRLTSRGTGPTRVELMDASTRGYRELPEFETFAVVPGARAVDEVLDQVRDIVCSRFQLAPAAAPGGGPG